MLLSCEAVGGTKNKAIPFVCLPELLHNGTIIVDDVEDNSALRRGKPSTHLLVGIDVAVNAGNALYFLPLLSVLNASKLNKKTRLMIYDLYVREMLNLSFGQATDIYLHRGLKNKVTEKQSL